MANFENIMGKDEFQDKLKKLYQPAITDEVKQNGNYLSRIFGEKNIAPMINSSGSRAQFYTDDSRTGSVGSVSEDAALKEGDTTTGQIFEVDTKEHQGSMKFNTKAIKIADGNMSSYVDVLDRDMKVMTRDLKNDYGRQLYGDEAGTITAAEDFAAGAWAVATDATGATQATGAAATFFVKIESTNALDKGMKIDFADASGSIVLSTVKIVDVLDSGSVIQIAKLGTHGGVDNVYVEFDAAAIVAGVTIHNSDAKSHEINGLKDIIEADTNYFGMAATVITAGESGYNTFVWADKFVAGTKRPGTHQSTKVSTAASIVTADDFKKLQQGVEIRSQHECTTFTTSLAMSRSYAGGTIPFARINRDSTTSAKGDLRTGGYGRVEFEGSEILEDRFAPDKRIWAISDATMQIAVLGKGDYEFEGQGQTGSMFYNLRDSNGKFTKNYGATALKYSNLFSTSPRAHGLIVQTGDVKVITLDETKVENIGMKLQDA